MVESMFIPFWDSFFSEKAIVHQSSCVQNGFAERKNKHILEITRALLFTYNVPKYLWGDALLHAVFLINRVSSKVLSFATPLKKFLSEKPDTRHFVDLPL